MAGVPERVDVGAIERELHHLWSSLDGEAVPGSGGAAAAPLDGTSRRDAPASQITRICTLTLLAVVRNGRSDEMAAIAERLSARYPSRSVILDLSPGKDLAVEIALNCYTPGSPRPIVCCEQITVSTSRSTLGRVPALVLPLLVPDLPAYVWWPDDPPSRTQIPERAETAPDPDAELLRRLVEVADVLIVDSSAMRRPVAGLRTAAALADRLSGGLRDLTWGRLTPWRELIVQCFDPAPTRQALEHLNRIHIRTAPGGPSNANDPIAGLLLGGWVAGRLGWEPAGVARREGGAVRALFWRDGGGIELSVEGGAGPVLSFECSSAGAEACTVSMACPPGAESAVTIETRFGRGRPRRTAAGLAAADDTTLIGTELELSGADEVLREAVEVVLRVLPDAA